MKNYTLGLLGFDSLNLASSRSSMQMNFTCLKSELSKLSNIDLRVLPVTAAIIKQPDMFFDSFPNMDFLMIHMCSGDFLNRAIIKSRPKVSGKICSFIEHTQPGFDFCFTFKRKRNTTEGYIPYPYSKEFMLNVPKVPKTILVDFIRNQYKDFKLNMDTKLAVWLKPLADEGYKIYQIIKKDGHVFANFVEPFVECAYKEYMEKSSTVESFIITAVESYGHSVIDMAGRGIRVLVPREQPEYTKMKAFLHPELITELELPTFIDSEELSRVIKEPVDTAAWDAKIKKMTEYKDAVAIIDNYFQKCLSS